MEEMRVYVANLGKYNEGELVGDWFEPPIDYDEMAERIGLNEQYEELSIPWLQSHSIRYREPSIPNDRAT